MKIKRMMWLSGLVLTAVVLLGLLVALFSRGSVAPVQAQTTPIDGYSGISVQGTGIIAVKPDVVRLNMGLQLKEPSVSEAQKKAAERSKQLTDALKQAGIKEEDIKTEGYNIYPEYQYRNNDTPLLTGYRVSTSYSVIIRDVNKAGAIIDVAGQAGANQIGGISFTLDNNAEALKQARAAAMEDARKTADQLAAPGKIQVGSVIKVIEQSHNVGPQPKQFDTAEGGRSAIAAAAPVQATSIETGQFRVIVNVQVTYAINK